ncbi:MAG TPA: 8-amino-7-oxononanoate synthase [Actinomycetota bacterium]|nr:8-amino-7-oxononanoate synthase [Actinomycetota bacterium]
MRPLSNWDDWISSKLDRLERDGLMRRLRPGDRTGPRTVARDGRELVNFSSNDYLGLSQHPGVLAAAERDLQKGTGATASRLMAGTDHDYTALENAVAFFKGTEAALVFGSGYLANVGTIPALVGRHDAVFSDRLNHASIVDGIRLSGAQMFRYRHNDVAELQQMLDECRDAKRKLIVTETLFGMDGDLAPLERIVELKERYGAALMVDEAHAVGVLGPQGRGLAHAAGVADRVDLHMGTFSKAVGLYGGYVAARESWIRYLVNAARSFVYTTALPPSVVGGISAALEFVLAADYERERIAELSGRFRQGLEGLGLDRGGSVSQIQPVMFGGAAEVVDLGRRLEKRGVLAVPIRPPTVPQGGARLRFSICASHTEQDIDLALSSLDQVARELTRAG